MRAIRFIAGNRVARIRAAIGCALVGGCVAAAVATAGEVARIRWFSAPDHTRVVLDLDGPADYEVRRVGAPERLAVNVPAFRFATAETIAVNDGLVERIRCNEDARRAQVVLDLAGAAPWRSFALKAADGRPDRIVLDVLRPEPAAPGSREPAAAGPARFRVIVDPGHGGLDPGTIFGEQFEKDLVLDVAQKLAVLLQAVPGYEVVLTRDGDWYPSLGERVQTAVEHDGDLFVSIHCNSHRDEDVRGMEVYFLSLQGATDREAQELADAENAADLVGLAAGHDTSDAVLSILMDLHMARVLRQSSRLAECCLAAAKAQDIETRRIKQAQFQVLRSLAMPSLLVELAYLSNREDRRLLTSDAGRRKLAAALAAGILDYRRDVDAVAAITAPPQWSTHYKVRQGDNLWRLARKHGTTVAEICERNNLRSERIQAGQYLSLPEGRPAS